MFSKDYAVLCLWTGLFLLLTGTSSASASSLKLSLLETISPRSIASNDTTGTDAAESGLHLSEPLILAAAQDSELPDTPPSLSQPAQSTVAAAHGLLPLNDGSGNRTTDWNGLWLDTGIFLGTQFVACAVIFVTPQSFSGWSADQKKDTFSHYGNNFVHPVFDKDQFYINFVLHPYWGATYYTRGRERGLDTTAAFTYSFLMSALYEFGPECFFEKPSIQDIFVTPSLGSLLGALVFEPWRNSIKRKEELRWYDHVALVATDPLGVLSLGVETVLGVKSTILVDYSPQKQPARAAGTVAAGSRLMLTMQFPFN
jgi:hypothetical protein